ncbi:MAG: hypothetical protein GXP16_05620 [Gammaproteobacteria bacterium]|nr:hypothetical protein [Gammaproteobacteria bacterium]
MNYEWHDFVGNVGVFLILLCYLLVQLGRIDTQGIRYSIGNGVGAGLLCVSLYINFNLSGLLIEISWLLISIFGLYQSVTRTRADPGEG